MYSCSALGKIIIPSVELSQSNGVKSVLPHPVRWMDLTWTNGFNVVLPQLVPMIRKAKTMWIFAPAPICFRLPYSAPPKCDQIGGGAKKSATTKNLRTPPGSLFRTAAKWTNRWGNKRRSIHLSNQVGSRNQFFTNLARF